MSKAMTRKQLSEENADLDWKLKDAIQENRKLKLELATLRARRIEAVREAWIAGWNSGFRSGFAIATTLGEKAQ